MPSSSVTLLNFSVKNSSRNNGHFTIVGVAEIACPIAAKESQDKKRDLKIYIYQRKEKWIKKKKKWTNKRNSMQKKK
jgi:sarcosine oxidase delta subunit